MTEHFTYQELVYSSTAKKKGIDNTPSAQNLNNLKKHVHALEYIRAYLGNHPVVITSGYRCPELNRAVGGVSNSTHQDGNTFDFKVKMNENTIVIGVRLLESDLSFDQLIIYENFIHISFDKKRRRMFINNFKKPK